MKKSEDIQRELNQFRGGGMFYQYPNQSNIKYTEGIEYLRNECSAHWLINIIANWQFQDDIIMDNVLQVFHLKVEDYQGILEIKDGNGIIVKEEEIIVTDFPLKEIQIWLMDGTILLPSEY